MGEAGSFLSVPRARDLSLCAEARDLLLCAAARDSLQCAPTHTISYRARPDAPVVTMRATAREEVPVKQHNVSATAALATLVLTALAGACGGSDSPAPPPGASVEFLVPRSGVMPPFFSLPFPTDLRVKADGTLNLDGFPDGVRPDALTGFLAIFSRETKGAATNGAAYFHFTAPVDPATLPTTANATSSGASAFLIDVDPTSPRRGTRHPLQIRHWATASVYVPANTLALLPYPGIPLRPKTKYAAVVTNRVKTAAGVPLVANVNFAPVMSRTASSDPELEKARLAYAPAFDALETMGVPRADIVSLASFTTSDPGADLRRMRAWMLQNVAEPGARELACTDEALYVRCTGSYSQPHYRVGVAPYNSEGGNFVFDAQGNPVEQGRETMLFTVTLPKTDMPVGGYPITLVSHGTGGDRNSFLGQNDTGHTLALRGIAAIGIDQPLQGARDTYCPSDPTGRENCENFWTFNPANFVAARENFRQATVDNFLLTRLVKRLTLAADLAHKTAEVKFDAQKVYFFGHSQGGIVGPVFTALEADVRGAVISGGGGSMGYGLLFKTNPTDIKGAIELLLGIEGKNELELAHPLITLVQGFIEPADPVNYGEAIAFTPPAGGACKHVLVTQGLGDTYTPNQATEALATSIVVSPANPVLSQVLGLELRGRSALAPPISSNLTAVGASTGCTAVLAQYPRASDAATNGNHDGHFVVYWNATARKQYGDFLGSLARDGAATFVVP